MRFPPSVRRARMARLPEAMRPAMFIMLEVLPLTTTGKVDRQALPAPEQTRPPLEAPYVAPRTALEVEQTRLWAELLGCQRVGSDDPFLALGGDSLLATQLIARVRAIWQVEVPLRLLLEAPTVADMAVLILQDLAARLEPAVMKQLMNAAEAL